MTTNELKDLLTTAAADLPDIDFAESAWARAHQQRRRHRIWTTAVAGAAAAAVIIGGVVLADRPVAPAPVTPARTGATHTPSETSTLVSPEIVVAPSLAELRERPQVSRFPTDLELPAERATLTEVLASAGSDAENLRVLALSWDVLDESRFEPVVLLRGDTTGPVWASIERVLAPPDPNNLVLFAGPRAISPDGRRVGLIQGREVLLVDVLTGGITSIPLPAAAPSDLWLQRGGFAQDGTYLAWTMWVDGETYAATPTSTELEPVEAGSRPDGYALVSETGADDALGVAVVEHSPTRAPVPVAHLALDAHVLTDSASGQGWVAAGLAGSESATEALLVSTVDGERQKMLVRPDDPDVPWGAYVTPIAFLDHTEEPTLVFRYVVSNGMGETPEWERLPTMFGAWNLVTDEVSFVAEGPALDLNLRMAWSG